jgi:hypothetical protein
VCRFSFSLSVMPLTTISGKYMILGAGFCVGNHRRCRVIKKGFSSRAR